MNNTQIFILVVLVGIDLLLTAIRSSLLNVRFPRLVSLGEEGDKRVETTMELVTRRARTRSTLKLSQALIRFLIAGLALLNFVIPDINEAASWPLLGSLLLIGVLIWLLEFILERVILQDPESWSLRLTPTANFLIKLLSPLLYLPLKLSQSSESRNLVTITEDELIHLVDASQQAGEIEKDESEMIHSVFEFGDTLAREIMVPRVDMLALEVNTPLDTAADTLLESGFSRVPVFENQIDNIIGLLYTKDMLQVWRVGDEISSLRNLLRPARFVPETKKVDELLDEMQAARIHIAIVVDEYGGVAGVVTLEDIVEEIFGEIQDEYDNGEEDLWEQVGPDEYIFDGRTLLEDINDVMEIELPTEEADTIGGLIFARIGSVPEEGDVLDEAGVKFEVQSLQERRVHKVSAVPASSDPNESSDAEENQNDHN
ncbi:MAG TPA: hemolysin family protein [Anaerolineales bacterium]|nr:hemolysin family protein [Anaerolineales bacterium]